MSTAEIRRALEPAAEVELPFAATKRKIPRQFPPPYVPHFTIAYRQWDGPKLTWAEDFGKGKGQVYSRDGTEPLRSCNEVEVAKRLRLVRDHAVWVSSYSPSQIPPIWRPWAVSPAEAPDWLQEIDRRIRVRTGAATGGLPDVIAWNNRDPIASAILVECKGRRESFKEGQEEWLRTALEEGVSLDQVAVAVRPF